MLMRLLRSALQSRASSSSLVARALELRRQGRLAEAEQTLRAALKEDPRDAGTATNLAVALLEQDRADEAVKLLQHAIACDARCAAAHFNYANVLRASGMLEHAIEHYRAAATVDVGFPAAPEQLMHALLEACAWDEAQRVADELRARVSQAQTDEWMPYVSPLTAVYLKLDDEHVKRVATYHVPAAQSLELRHFAAHRSNSGGRIRIGYFSRDFRDHPVGHLLRSALALHDRDRFEVFAFSYGVDDRSTYRAAIEQSVDRFIDVAHMNDDEAARSITKAGVHVLIDLMGHTTGNRLGVLARRPAPVQAHYLGYAATTGAPYIDYFISDENVTPRELQNAFTEELACVPECFMVSDGSDAKQAIASTREEEALPAGAYVFCNFANASRITRDTFALWMRILQNVPAGVLWLKASHPLVVKSLTREAQRAGVEPGRLIFARRAADKPSHLGRLALADLALDTLEWHNGHTTTSDMLWAGVPVLTSPGRTFASRVATSLVRAAELPEVIASNTERYVACAVELSENSGAGRALRSRLSAESTAPFFDSPRLVRGLEQVYEGMFAAKMRRSEGL